MIYKFNYTLKDATPYGNAYFARAFDIQGVVREEWLKQNNLLNSLKEYQLITKQAHNEYIKECLPFANYEAELIVKKIDRASFIFDIEIRDKETGEIHSKGWQKICFAKNGKRKLVAIPEEFKKALINNLMIKKYIKELKKLDDFDLIGRLIEISDKEKLSKEEEKAFHDELEKNGVKIPVGTGC